MRSRLSNAVMRGMTAVGERWDVDWLIYNPLQMRWYDERARRDAPAVMRSFARLFPTAQRYVDVGAGSGGFAIESHRQGREVVACERSAFGRLFARRRGIAVQDFDLEREPPAHLLGPFDLAYCFEVAEHLSPRLGDRLVAFLSTLAPLVVFTAAPPGQGGVGHVNEQPLSYWTNRFAAHGLEYDSELSGRVRRTWHGEGVQAPYLLENVMTFRCLPST
jgi:SAM-dependent methyltransferase